MVFRSGNTLVPLLLAMLVLAPGASAWAWPVDGPVLRPFVADRDPYTGGQHRGIDIGAPTGADVRSAATGVVAFAGQLPRQGLCLTVRTADGYSVTLVHLGSISVPVGTNVSEGDVVGTIGPSGDPEGTEPYVYLGIRLTAEPNGYLDPLTLLPPRQAQEQPPVTRQQQQPVAPPTAPVARQATPPSPVARASAKRPAPVRKPGPSTSSPIPSSTRALRATTPSSRPASSPLVRRHATPEVARRARPRARHRSVSEPAPVRVRAGDAPELQTPESRRPAKSSAAPGVRPPEASHPSGWTRLVLLLAMSLVGLGLLAVGVVRRGRPAPVLPRQVARRPLRKMSPTEPAPEERLPEPSTTTNSRRGRVALREWPTASRTCRRLRSPLGHHGPVSPPSRRLRPDGQRHRRARDAGHGRRRSRRALSA